MKKPNFFIAAAPRCGTTSMHTYLAEHPQVFMSTPKETYFWAMDLPTHRKVQTLEDYLGLFSDALEQHQIIGESTPLYLFSKDAIPLIHKFAPEARFLLMFRDPIKEVISHHALKFYNGSEDEADFEKAWRLQKSRRLGENIPKYSPDPKLLQYGEIAKYGEQLEWLLKYYPKDQVHVTLTEELALHPAKEYASVLISLKIQNPERSEFPRKHRQRHYRFSRLSGLIRKPPRFAIKVADRVKYTFGIDSFGVFGRVKQLLTTDEKKTIISPELDAELREWFRKDIKKLEALTGKNLGTWLNPRK